MKLSELIKNTDVISVAGNKEIDISDIAYNASSVGRGMCFVAIRGAKTDGHKFISEAIRSKAAAIVSEDSVCDQGIVNVVVPDSRRALADMSTALFGDPSDEMLLTGVTGTNGKTTVTYLLEKIFEEAGMLTGVIGTVACRFAGVEEEASHTTPESYNLQKLLRRMRSEGVNACAMEVSSHSLAQSRVRGCRFNTAIFTNLTPEHLDFHDDMESYFAAKALLFEEVLAAGGKKDCFAVINADDKWGLKLADRSLVPVVLFGFNDKAHVRGSDLSVGLHGLAMKVSGKFGEFGVRSMLKGRFNAENILAAAAAALNLGIGAKTVAEAILCLSGVPGRFEAVPNDRGILAVVDYAHTPDAVENVLANAREFVADKAKLIAVFGCGGDRDRAKRPLMGSAAGKLSDAVIITSDNPRTEDPNMIIDEIMTGVVLNNRPMSQGKGYEVIPDRRQAIERAVKMANKGDVVVVAGKGHENYQIIGTKRIHFDDREILRECLLKKA